MRTHVSSLHTIICTIVRRCAVRRMSIAALCALTARLPQDTRRVLTLYKVYDYSVPAIAARLALTPAQVEHHLITAAHAVAEACSQHTGGSDSSESAADGAAEGAPGHE